MNYRQVSTNDKKCLILSKEETNATKVHYDIDGTLVFGALTSGN